MLLFHTVTSVLALVAGGTGTQQVQERPQALATAINNIESELVDEHDIRAETLLDERIDGLHVVGDQRLDVS